MNIRSLSFLSIDCLYDHEICSLHQAAMIPGMGSKTQTIKDFDTLKVNEMSQGLMFEILPAVFMHLVKKKG